MSYYSIAKKASQTIGKHQGLLFLKAQAAKSKRILDVGCGEGTRLNTLLSKNQKGTGVDISPKALNIAKSQYPHHNFIHTKNETLPFKNDYFDLVYTAFVLEHVQDPEKFIQEMIRVTKPNGLIVFLAPNYGSPNRRSPNSTQNPIKKLIVSIYYDFFPQKNNKLNWVKVTLKKQFNKIDDDTVCEPYLYSLINFLKINNLKIQKSSSLWELEAKTIHPRKLLFLFLGRLSIFPFRYWGPQIFVSAVKP